MTERRYSEEEVALILRKAVESTPGVAGAGDESHALTLAELKEVAGEAGIDPVRIEAAARSLDVPGSAAKKLFGIPVAVQLNRFVEVELSEDDLPKMLIIIRNVLGRQGIVSEVLGGLEWQARGATGGQYVSIRPQDGGVQLQVLGNFRDGVFGIGFASGLMGLMVGGMLGAFVGLPAAGIAAATLSGGAGAGYAPWRFFFPDAERTLSELMDRLEHYLVNRPDEEGPVRSAGTLPPP